MKNCISVLSFLLFNTFVFCQSNLDYMQAGMGSFFKRDYNTAISYLTKEISRRDKNSYPAALTFRGQSKYAIGDYAGAVSDYDKAIDFVQINPLSFFYRGMAKAKLQDFKGAIADYTTCINTITDDLRQYRSAAFLNRGFARINSGNKHDGCTDLRTAGELGEKEAFAYIKQYCN